MLSFDGYRRTCSAAVELRIQAQDTVAQSKRLRAQAAALRHPCHGHLRRLAFYPPPGGLPPGHDLRHRATTG
jgi:hypothetical protein